MPKVKFRFRLTSNKADGVPLPQLGKVAEEAAKFFKFLSDDLSIEFKAEDWIAIHPRRGSFAFDIASAKDMNATQARKCRTSVAKMARYKPRRSKPPRDLRRETLIQFAKIGTGLEEGQAVEVGVYDETKRRRSADVVGEISSASARKMLDSLEEVVQYYGSIQGRIHGLNVGSTPAFFILRELSSGSLVRCEFKPEAYQEVLSLFRKLGSVAMVSGFVSASREHRSIIRIAVERVEECGDVGVEEFEAFFGSAPNLTGNLSTEEFIDLIRSEGDDE